jgi:hypothetical protein
MIIRHFTTTLPGRFDPLRRNRSTRQQIIKMTSKTGSLVASNKAGVAPVNQKHVARFAALKAAASVQKKESTPVRKKG